MTFRPVVCPSCGCRSTRVTGTKFGGTVQYHECANPYCLLEFEPGAFEQTRFKAIEEPED